VTRQRFKVLVPDDTGLEVLGTSPDIEAARYEPGTAWPPAHLDATVVVVGYQNAQATGARFAELPGLRLVQTLNAGYEQWLPLLPDGVLLSNGRGAHGGSTAEWVVAVLLAIYRDLPRFNAHQSHGVWRPSVALFTDTRTRLKASSIDNPGSLAAVSSAVVYGLLAPLPSSASAPGEVENDRKVPGAPNLASTIARP